jgi:hypothetical protein
MKTYTRKDILNLLAKNNQDVFRVYLKKDIFPMFCKSALDVLNKIEYNKMNWEDVKIVKDNEYRNYIKNKIREQK